MNNIRYHEVQPSNSKQIFQGDDLVDFELESFGRKLVKNSIEICGTMQTTKVVGGTTSRIVHDDVGLVFMDKNAGVHSIIENVSCSTLNQGSVESIGFSYPRFAGLLNVLQKRNQDKNNVSDVLEWTTPDYDLTDNKLRQQFVTDGSAGGVFNYDSTFNFKPKIVFNRTDSDVSFAKTGKMRISINLSSPEKCIVNQLTTADTISYTITDLKLRFRSVPDDGAPTQVIAQKLVPLKTTINSSLSSMSLNVPSQSATGCSISFQNTSNEGNPKFNNSQLEKINITGLQFFFNSANTYLNYQLKNRSEILLRGLKSLSPNNDEATYQCTSTNFANDENYVVGTDLDGIVDLSQNSFEVQIESDIQTNTNVYLAFHSIISM